jgi:hypothetical protein
MMNGAAWSMSSALIQVSDLDRSVSFYMDVCSLQEILREADAAILGSEVDESATLFLKRANRSGLRTGQETMGVRSIGFYSGSTTELDRVEERLKALGAHRDRRQFGEGGRLCLVRGHDPDRLPLGFLSHDPNRPPTGAEQKSVSSLIYGWDV